MKGSTYRVHSLVLLLSVAPAGLHTVAIGTVDSPSEPIPVVSQEARVYIRKCDGRIYGNERRDSQSMSSRFEPGDPAVKDISSYSALAVSLTRLSHSALLGKADYKQRIYLP